MPDDCVSQCNGESFLCDSLLVSWGCLLLSTPLLLLFLPIVTRVPSLGHVACNSSAGAQNVTWNSSNPSVLESIRGSCQPFFLMPSCAAGEAAVYGTARDESYVCCSDIHADGICGVSYLSRTLSVTDGVEAVRDGGTGEALRYCPKMGGRVLPSFTLMALQTTSGFIFNLLLNILRFTLRSCVRKLRSAIASQQQMCPSVSEHEESLQEVPEEDEVGETATQQESVDLSDSVCGVQIFEIVKFSDVIFVKTLLEYRFWRPCSTPPQHVCPDVCTRHFIHRRFVCVFAVAV